MTDDEKMQPSELPEAVSPDKGNDRRFRAKRRRAKAFRTATELHEPKTFADALTILSDEERTFVQAYLKDPNGPRAYRTAFPQAIVTKVPQIVDKLLRRIPVRTALALGRKETAAAVAKAANYQQQEAFQELGDAMDFARDTNNATALARLIELRARITGALIDRSQVQTQGFNLVIHEKAPQPAIDITPVDKIVATCWIGNDLWATPGRLQREA